MDERRRRRVALRPTQGGQPRTTRGERPWYSIKNDASDDSTEILLYDVIDPWWGVSADQFVRDLQQVSTSTILLRINSPGGDVFDGWAIYQALRNHKAFVITQIDSLAASSASVVAMAGDLIVMAKPSDLMIHDPWSGMMGDAVGFRKEADLLDKLGGQIAEVYADRAGGTVAEWRDRMLAETWLTEQEAVDIGLADQVKGQSTAAKDSFDRSIFDFYKNTPERVMRRQEILRQDSGDQGRDLTVRGAERTLRDAGWSREQAKAILAKGSDTGARDATPEERLLAGIRQLRQSA